MRRISTPTKRRHVADPIDTSLPMGIEPILLIGIVVAMFLVQVVRAAHNALTDRLEYALLTMDGAGEHASQRAMAPEPLPGAALTTAAPPGPQLLAVRDRPPSPWARSWSTLRPDGRTVRLVASRRPGPVRQAVYLATGVRQRFIDRHRKWLAPSVLVLVTLPRTVVEGLTISPRALVVPDAGRLDLRSPVLDHLLRVATDEPSRTSAILADPSVHEPLIELMAMHPLSIVTGRVVALWCAQAVHDPEPLLDLALEVSDALLAATARLDAEA